MGFKKEEKVVETLPIEEEPVEETEEEIVEEVEEVDLSEEQAEATKIINEKRKEYLDYTKSQKKYNYIFTGVLFVVMIGAFVLLLTLGSQEENKWVSYISLGAVLIMLIITFVVSKQQRKKLDAKSFEYVDHLWEVEAKYTYFRDGVKDMQIEGKVENREDFLRARFYKNLNVVKSRFGCAFTYKGKAVKATETAGSVTQKRGRANPKFLGKFFIFESTYEKPSRIIFQLKGKEFSVPVDDIDDLKLVEGNDKYCIYTNDEEYKEFLTPKVLTLLKKFKIDNQLYDVILSIHEKEVSLGIDYSDEFFKVPVDTEYNFKNADRMRKDMDLVYKIIEELK